MPVTVIAKLALGRWVVVGVVAALAAWALFAMALHPGASDPIETGAVRVGGFLGGIVALAGLIYGVCVPAIARGRAVWIQDGQLVHVDVGRMRTPLTQIQDVTLGDDTANASGVQLRYDVIALRLRDGRTVQIRTSMLSEGSDVVMARLKEALARHRGAA